jgi:hypothetical protein
MQSNATTSSLVKQACVYLALFFCSQLSGDGAPGAEDVPKPRSFQVTGTSRYRVLNDNGTWQKGDTNDFQIVVGPCSWNVRLQPNEVPQTSTQVADDGTNAYVLVTGSERTGTVHIGNDLVRYFDSGRINHTGRNFPKRHGTAVWLLFGSDCMFRAAQGTVGDVLDAYAGGEPGNRTFSYEKSTDVKKNSFGPSLLRIYVQDDQRSGPRELLGELEVLSSRQQGTDAVPETAQLRLYRPFSRRPAQVVAAFDLSLHSAELLDKAPTIRPAISRATSVVDYRTGSYMEYVVSDDWESAEAAQARLKIGNYRGRTLSARTLP